MGTREDDYKPPFENLRDCFAKVSVDLAQEEFLISGILKPTIYNAGQLVAIAFAESSESEKLDKLFLTQRGVRESQDPRLSSSYEEHLSARQVMHLDDHLEDADIKKVLEQLRINEQNNKLKSGDKKISCEPYPQFYIALDGERVLALYIRK